MARLSCWPLCLALAALAAQAAPRAFVASHGSDANTASQCAFATPCRGFAAAMTVVDPGGEIVALDAAGYGAVNITKSVTITANPGVYAGISASTGIAVTIATGGIAVTLRHLNINGSGATTGIALTGAGTSLAVENCVISNFAGVQNRGIDAFGDVRLRLLDTVVRNNYTGVHVADNAEAAVARGSFVGNTNYSLVVVSNVAGLASANVSDSLFSGPGVAAYAHGVHASGTARIFVTRSTIAGSSVALAAESNPGIAQVIVGLSAIVGNGYAYYQSGPSSGVLSSGNNTFAGNSTSSGTLTYLAPQ